MSKPKPVPRQIHVRTSARLTGEPKRTIIAARKGGNALEKSDQQINAETIDRWVAGNWEWGRPISHEEYEAARRETWNVLLTPIRCPMSGSER